MGTRQLISSSKIVKCHVNTSDGSPTYEAGTAYEAGTVVIFQNVVYMAITDISADETATPDEDPDVWAIVSDSTLLIDGDIEALAQRVQAIENALPQMNQDIDDLETGLQNEVETRASLGAHNLLKVNPITMMNSAQSGWSATISGNVITYANQGGFTITINDDDSITANGTPTANLTLVLLRAQSGDVLKLSKNKYFLKGSNNSNATIKINGVMDGVAYSGVATVNDLLIDVSDSFDLGSNGNIYVEFKANNAFSNFVIYPMIRLATDTYTGYTPYVPTNAQLEKDKVDWASNGVLGAKNLFDTELGVRVANGITYTRDSNGVITANGTAIADSWNILNNYKTLKAGTYILTGCPANGSSSTYFVYTEGVISYDYGEGATFTLTNDTSVRFGICIKNGQSPSNLKFYPMLRLATDSDPTYQPYAMTNRELTTNKMEIADLKTIVAASSDFSDFQTRIAAL